MRALVTGGAGFIGSTLVDRLLAEGHAVDVVDDLSHRVAGQPGRGPAQPGRAPITFHQLDIRSPDVVELDGAAPARGRVPPGRPGRRAGVGRRPGPRRRDQRARQHCSVLEGARARGRRKVVFASSGGTIYGDPDPADLPVKETHPQRPLSPYGVAKKVVGDYLYAYRELHDLEFTALALANVYGPRQDPHGEAGVVAIFAGRLLAGEPCTIFGDGEPDPGLRLRRRRGRRLRPGRRAGAAGCCLNIGTGVETSRQRAVRDHGRPPPAWTRPAVYAPARPGELQRSSPRPGRAAIHLGWKPWTSLDGRHPRPSSTGSDRPARSAELRQGSPSGTGPPVRARTISSRTDELAQPGRVDAPDDGHRDAGGLAHDQLGGAPRSRRPRTPR